MFITSYLSDLIMYRSKSLLLSYLGDIIIGLYFIRYYYKNDKEIKIKIKRKYTSITTITLLILNSLLEVITEKNIGSLRLYVPFIYNGQIARFNAFSLCILNFNILYLVILSKVFLQYSIYKHHIVSGIFIVIFSIIIFFVDSKYALVVEVFTKEVILVILNEFFISITFVVDKFLLVKKEFFVIELLLMKGIFGLFFSIIINLLIFLINKSFPQIRLNVFIDSLFIETSALKKIIIFFCYMIFNVSNIFIIDYYIPSYIGIVNFLTIFPRFIYNHSVILDLNSLIPEIIVFILLLFFGSFFCEILVFNYFGLEKNTRIYIIERGNKDLKIKQSMASIVSGDSSIEMA